MYNLLELPVDHFNYFAYDSTSNNKNDELSTLVRPN